MRRWEALDPAQRAEARELFKRMRVMTPADRIALREQWKTMTAAQRAAWFQAHPAPPRPPHPGPE